MTYRNVSLRSRTTSPPLSPPSTVMEAIGRLTAETAALRREIDQRLDAIHDMTQKSADDHEHRLRELEHERQSDTVPAALRDAMQKIGLGAAAMVAVKLVTGSWPSQSALAWLFGPG
jgi:aminopeptidase N